MPKGPKRRRPKGAPMDAYSVQEFCDAHGISQGFYYVLKRRGEAPREMQVGRRRMVSKEAGADWRRARETNACACPDTDPAAAPAEAHQSHAQS